LLLDHGTVAAFGPPDQVLAQYERISAGATEATTTDQIALTDADSNQTVYAESPVVQSATDGIDRTQATPNAAKAKKRSHTGSFISRLDPRAKMLTFLVMMLTAFAITTPVQLALGAVVVTAIMVASGLSPLRVLRSVRLFLALLVVMSVLNVFVVRTGTLLLALGPIVITTGGIWTAALYACRFALVIVLGAIMLQTTTPTQMTDSLESLLKPLGRLGLHTHEISLVMSLALRFIPTLTGECQSIIQAQSARGGSIETGSLAQRIRAMTAIIVPVFAGTLRHADNLSLALDARCYEGGARRTHYRQLRLTWRDTAFCVACAAYLVLLLAIQHIL
jgi:energy-coupling factor transport system ATP-binding protein